MRQFQKFHKKNILKISSTILTRPLAAYQCLGGKHNTSRMDAFAIFKLSEERVFIPAFY
jgi:hypothetical protein